MRFSVLCVLGLLLASTGCVDDNNDFDFVGTELGRTRIDDLSRAIEIAGNERQLDQREFQSNLQSSLNRWVANSESAVSALKWEIDPLWKPLQESAGSAAVLKETGTLNFIDTDSQYMQELAWLKLINGRWPKTKLNSLELYRLAAGNFTPAETDSNPSAAMFRKLHPTLDDSAAAQLAQAHLLFDWLMRNVQLLPDVEDSKSKLDELKLNDREGLAAAGIPGTGYQRFPQQVLLYGRGDYIDRAKLFIDGLRLMGMDSVMLGVAGESNDAEPLPWVVAVPIAGQYYLFDTRLALPIPSATLGATATLAELSANPNLLDQLSLTVEESLEENTKYWVKPEQLKKLVGLLYIAPETASRRFALMQKNLSEAQQLPYFVAPSDLAKRLPTIDGIQWKVWDIAVKTHQFRQAVREALEDKTNNELRERLGWYFSEEGYIDDFPRYRTARVRFFMGRFENEKELLKFNAIDSYQALMFTDQDVENLATDVMLQERLGILSADRDSVEFKNRLRSVQGHMKLVARDMVVFLTQAHFDNNNFGASENWVKILRARTDVDRWKESIDYLGARAVESQKDYDSAISEFRKNPKNLQAHGNIIRARLLKAAIKKIYET